MRRWHGRLGTDFGRRWSRLARRAAGGARRPVVLVEEPRSLRAYADWRQLSDGGYDPRWCPGPGALKGRCPLVASGHCDLVEQADVVVSALGATRRSARDVVGALHGLHPDRPLVVAPRGRRPWPTGDDARFTPHGETAAILGWVSSALADARDEHAPRAGSGPECGPGDLGPSLLRR